MLNYLSQPKPKLFIDCQSHQQRNAPDKVNPDPPLTWEKAGTWTKVLEKVR